MRAKATALKRLVRRKQAGIAGLGLITLLALCAPRNSLGQAAGPETFSSPAEACHALMRAVQSHDAQGIRAILGGGKELSSSGDESSDKVERELIGRKYLEMHRLVRDSDGTMVLYLGAENWPFPIPLVSENGRWHFDAEAGKEEMFFRRIGENEMTAIQVCEASAMARKHRRASGVSEDPVSAYAVTLVSRMTPAAGRSANTVGEATPFHGYSFRVLAGTGNLALVAYPAEYRTSGVMTFAVTRKGAIYEKDLGQGTAGLAQNLKTQKEISGWSEVK